MSAPKPEMVEVRRGDLDVLIERTILGSDPEVTPEDAHRIVGAVGRSVRALRLAREADHGA